MHQQIAEATADWAQTPEATTMTLQFRHSAGMDATAWLRFDRPEQFQELLAEVGDKRRELREAELRIKTAAEDMVVRAIQLGMAQEEAARLTGYSAGTLTKWVESSAARRAHAISQQVRDEAKARAREKRLKVQREANQPSARSESK
ncbi:hypothetical protein [Streptomyces sp. TRM68416]|uniref:hypothetical protein n=1 Tax=Streptomyces sp. TRM68416 TaxID=2758412 RepID=UPI001661EB24|nr:hypothetical protein [Streptomyces sp. TRM68416]MBD0844333.1 hypothetical protein [Streptomyces sp. TRM68416]